jgi:hypothetical protein
MWMQWTKIISAEQISDILSLYLWGIWFKASPFNQVLLWFSVVYPSGCWDRLLKQVICLLPDSYHSWTSSHLILFCKICTFETRSLYNLILIGADYTRWSIQTFILTCWMIFCVLHRFWATDFESDSKSHVAHSERCLFIWNEFSFLKVV